MLDIIAKRLVSLRKERDISQRELAKGIGRSASIIASYELGQRTPGGDILIDLAKYFSCTTDYLLGLSNARTGQVKIDDDLLELLERTVEGLRKLR